VYDEFAVQILENVSSLVFEYDGEFPVIASLYGDDVDLFVEVFALDEFLEDFFVVYFPEDVIGILVDEVERVVVEIKERLIEERLLQFFRCGDAMSGKIMMEQILACGKRLRFFFVEAEKFFQRLVDGLRLETHPDLFAGFKPAQGIDVMFPVMELEYDASDILHSSVEEFLYPVVEYMLRIVKKVVRRIGDGIDDESHLLTKEFVNGAEFDVFVVFGAIVQDACDKQVDIVKSFRAQERYIERMGDERFSGIFPFLSGMSFKRKIARFFDNSKILHENRIFR